MRVLILGINYAPEIISTGLYTTGMAEFLAAQGHKVNVVTAMPYYPAWKIMEGWPKFSYRRETLGGVHVMHAPLYVPRRPSGIKRIVHHVNFALTAAPVAIWLALRRRPDIVMVIAPSLISAVTGWIAARVSGAKSWLHVQDFEVEAALATGLIKTGTALARIAARFERWMLTRFDQVSSISAPMVERLLSKGVAADRVYEFRNWADLSAISPLTDVSPFKAELGITTPFVALYSGNIANKQGFEIIPQMVQHLVDRNDITIVICGDGPMRETLQEQCRAFPFIRFLPLQPRERLNDLLGMADVHLLPQVAGAVDLVLPSKLANMLASGRPVLATTPADTALGREVTGCGEVVAPGDAAGMARALTGLLDEPERRSVLGQAARRRAVGHWDGAGILGRLQAEMARLVQRPAVNGIDGEAKTR